MGRTILVTNRATGVDQTKYNNKSLFVVPARVTQNVRLVPSRGSSQSHRFGLNDLTQNKCTTAK